MKTFSLILVLAAATTPSFASEASPLCAAQRASIETQIREAQAAGRTRELSGLNRALAANNSRCSDAALTKERDARIKERDARIKKALKKVEAREKSLAEAAREGNLRGMQDRRNKLEEANRELAEAEWPIGQ